MTRSHLHALDQLMARALRLLGRAEAVEGQDQWERDVKSLRDAYRDFTLSLDDASPLSAAAAAVAVPTPDSDRYAAVRASGGVDVRAIVGEVMLGNPAAHDFYHHDPAMRHGIEVATGVLSIVAAVLVDEGDTPELAAHIVHRALHRLSDDAPPPGVDLAALGSANTALDLTRDDAPGTLP